MRDALRWKSLNSKPTRIVAYSYLLGHHYGCDPTFILFGRLTLPIYRLNNAYELE